MVMAWDAAHMQQPPDLVRVVIHSMDAEPAPLLIQRRGVPPKELQCMSGACSGPGEVADVGSDHGLIIRLEDLHTSTGEQELCDESAPTHD